MIEPKVQVDAAYLDSGGWQVEIAGKLYPASVSLRPLYDPQMKRIHG
jgi:4-methylaminobutanoate oxidase (formaldehyde-forming)